MSVNTSPALLWSLCVGTLVVGAIWVCPAGLCGSSRFDLVGLQLANAVRQPWLDVSMRGVTWFGSLVLLAPVVTMISIGLWRSQKKADAFFLLGALTGASALSHAAKLVVARPRPDLFPALTDLPSDWSFPSAHTAQITAVAVALGLRVFQRHQYLAAWLLCLAVVVGFSRVYLQVHFPSDVVVGMLVAVLWVGGLHALMFSGSGLPGAVKPWVMSNEK